MKEKIESRSVEGRAAFIASMFGKSTKAQAWKATHERFGWNTAHGKANFDKTWAKAERLAKANED